MAQFQHLPIYKAAYDLLLALMNLIKTFPKEYKYTLGEKIQASAMEVLILVYRANSAADKKIHIKNMIDHIQLIGIYLRVSMDLHIISTERYAVLVENLSSVSKQAHGWMK